MYVNEFWVALAADKFVRVVSFHRDGLGLGPGDLWSENGGRG